MRRESRSDILWRMTTQQAVQTTTPPSRKIAAEVRAELGRQGMSVRGLALKLGEDHGWVKRRIGMAATLELTVEDIDRIAEALRVPTGRIIAASGWLPRLDSNQQPFGYQPTQPTRPVIPAQRTAA